MAKTTKTLNPLHFEDLEPHRFEDMVRQLVYDLREWKSIEATGRLGSDEGIDIRAIEASSQLSPFTESDGLEEGEEEIKDAATQDLLWIIQCKRERAIGPKKIRNIIQDNITRQESVPYGYILVASCDFSKTSRDTFRQEAHNYGVEEFYLWGKAELEDMLFLPKNDHLLFAYFGISLQIRRRSIRTQLRSRIALKRKLVKELGGLREEHFTPVLIRDPRNTDYPNIHSKELFIKEPQWRYWWFVAHQPPDHLAFITRKHFAWIDFEKKKWDAILNYDVGVQNQPNLFDLPENWWDPDDQHWKYHRFWLQQVPEVNQAWYNEVRYINYDRILALDELGDSFNEGPHLLVEYGQNGDPFEPKIIYILETGYSYSRRIVRADKGIRVKFFPKVIPEPKEEIHGEASTDEGA
jgi:hypothetical protein